MSTKEIAYKLRTQIGDAAVLTGDDEIASYMRERRGFFPGRGQIVALPEDTTQVSEVVRICAGAGAKVVPQSGNTGLVGGGSPRDETEVVVSLRRMNRIRRIDAADNTVVAEAGCVLREIQNAAAEVDRLFPLSLPSEWQCCIGGNLATNAGGLNVVQYGNTRALTLGLEVVLADGRIWSGLSALHKDNSGYDLKDLFIGSEGTLGIITAATLSLFPRPRERRVALVALSNLNAALPLLRAAQAESGDTVVACEVMGAGAIAMPERHVPGCGNPLPGSPWYLLLEIATPDVRADLAAAMNAALESARQSGGIDGAEIAADDRQAAALWRLRTCIPGAQGHEGASIKHDISVPVSALPAFVETALHAVATEDPAVRPCVFGHVGDGNLHFNLTQPEGWEPDTFMERRPVFNRLIHDIVMRFDGSIAAEHGVGQLKGAEMKQRRDPVAHDMMRGIKRALDPDDVMNPGKVVLD